MNCHCFNTGRTDGLGSWVGGLATGVGSFLGGVLPIVAPVAGALLPVLLRPSDTPQPATGSRLEPEVTSTRQTQTQDRTMLIVGGVAIAFLLFTAFSKRRR